MNRLNLYICVSGDLCLKFVILDQFDAMALFYFPIIWPFVVISQPNKYGVVLLRSF